MPPKIESDTCAVDGCEKPRAKAGKGRRSVCYGHATRKEKTGDYGTEPLRYRAPNGSGADCHGYVIDTMPDHPLADGAGRVFRHRWVLYAAMNGEDGTCHWCSVPVFWKPEEGQVPLEVDHLDGIKDHNDPANVVPSCHPCNFDRAVNRG